MAIKCLGWGLDNKLVPQTLAKLLFPFFLAQAFAEKGFMKNHSIIISVSFASYISLLSLVYHFAICADILWLSHHITLYTNMNTIRKNGREEEKEERSEAPVPLINIDSNSSGEEQIGSQNSKFHNEQMTIRPNGEFGYGHHKNDQKNASNHRSNNQNMRSKLPSVTVTPTSTQANANDTMPEMPKPEPDENDSYETVNGLLQQAERLSTISKLVNVNLIKGCIPSPPVPVITYGDDATATAKESTATPAKNGKMSISTPHLKEFILQNQIASKNVEKLNAQKALIDREGVAFDLIQSQQINSNASDGTKDANNNATSYDLPGVKSNAGKGKTTLGPRKFRCRSASRNSQTYHTTGQDAVISYANIGRSRKVAAEKTNEKLSANVNAAECAQFMRGIGMLPVLPQSERTPRNILPQIRSNRIMDDQHEPTFSEAAQISNHVETNAASPCDNINVQQSSPGVLGKVELFNKSLSSVSFDTSSPNSPSSATGSAFGMSGQKPAYITQNLSQVRNQIAAKKVKNNKKSDSFASVNVQHVVAKKVCLIRPHQIKVFPVRM